MRSAVHGFWADEAAVTSIEYGLIMGFIAVLLILAMSSAGDMLAAVWNRISECIGSPGGGGC
ncbi:MAG: Flp family type IVb pilin [Pseudomonadota bacterium]|nr:Flp family type IVb pilin [Pseudomonadota bacterium]